MKKIVLTERDFITLITGKSVKKDEIEISVADMETNEINHAINLLKTKVAVRNKFSTEKK